MSLPSTLTTSIDVRARNAFFSHYISGFFVTYDVLGSLYEKAPSGGYLTVSVDAISLAFFAFQYGSSQASKNARSKYLDALPLLNEALKTPETATHDSTLQAVLLLDLFEKITDNNPRSTDSWMSHVNGALALVKMRDSYYFSTYTGLRLSIRLTTNLLISCLAANTPVPTSLNKLRSELEPFLNRDNPKWRVCGLVIKYVDLKGAIQHGSLADAATIKRALDLDQEFLALAESIHSAWPYETVRLERTSERVFEQHYDSYGDHFQAQAWNVLRIMRILLNDIVRINCAVRGISTFSQETSTSLTSELATTTIDAMAKDICATAPQFIGYAKSAVKSREFTEAQRLKSYTLLFPLYVAGLYVTPSSGIKTWIIQCLQFMANDLGVRNAKVVAEILERGDGTNPWSVYAILGSYAFAA